MVLWKRESTSAGAFYIDFLSEAANEFFSGKFSESMGYDGNNKDDDISMELRTQGNQRFKEQKWHEALELYNRCLRYATDESENISLAYANRSMCFFKIQMYDQCLVDIELAKKANYPQRLMPKLNDREAKCLKLISDKSWKPDEKNKPTLSFEADAQFPDLANVLEIQNNDKYGNHIVAKCDIDVGKIVMMGDMFVASIHNKDQTYCKTCLKSAMNFIPCPNCSEVMFCDDNCMASNKIHAMACSVLRNQIFIVERLVESTLIAVTAFESVGSLMEFVESALASSDFNAPECDSVVQNKYRSFLKLDVSNEDMNVELKRRIFMSFYLMTKIPVIEQRFQSTQEKRFLAHLILQHDYVLNKNSILFHIVYHTDRDNSTKIPDISGLWPIQPLISTNSCIRNVTVKHVKNQMFAYIVRPVLKGEPLFQENLIRKSDEQCKCSKCVPKWKQEDQNQLESDPDYQFIAKSHQNDNNYPDKRMILKTKYENLLQKYGRLPWSGEVEWMSKYYDWTMKKEFCD